MVEVRAARPADAAAIRHVHCAAFPTPAEANLVDALERDGDQMLSLVAVEGGTIVGHILFSRMAVRADEGTLAGLGLAPVAVTPDRQDQGIGSALIDAGLQAARSIGTEIVFVLGEPAYHGRFGFDARTAQPFASPYAGPYFQAKALGTPVNTPTSGRADYAPAFADLS
jgi:putative acetyltransferase